MEWSDKAKYNPFNSDKGLTWYEHYKKILDWYEGKKDSKLPPPIECSIDPICSCNLDCYYCNSQRYLKFDKEIVPAGKKLTKRYMHELIDFVAKWGVKGVCLGGGGEALLNEDSWGLPSYIAAKGMIPAVVTNGTIMNSDLARQLLYCQWVAFSVDAADEETYEKVHGVNHFIKVTRNIELLVEAAKKEQSHVDIAFRFLILPENANQILDACQMAKALGVKNFHVRPVDFERKDFRMAQKLELDIDKVNQQLDLCHQEETDTFRVFTAKHKFDAKFHAVHKFTRCLASPLVLQCCTDGFCYACVDHRIEEKFKLGKFYHIPGRGKMNPAIILEWWGSDAHRQLLKDIKPDEQCGRCTYGEYNRQIEEVVVKDNMHRSFP